MYVKTKITTENLIALALNHGLGHRDVSAMFDSSSFILQLYNLPGKYCYNILIRLFIVMFIFKHGKISAYMS